MIFRTNEISFHSRGHRTYAVRLGADEVVVSRNADEMRKHAGSFDFILDAVSADHDINAYIQLLRRDGNLTMVGAPEKPLPVSVFGLIMARLEVIPIQKVNEAYERLLKSDVKYRFSIDVASLKAE